MVDNLNDQLRRDEGWSGSLYKDSVGKFTIGYGHNLDDDGISASIAASMLEEDIKTASIRLENTLPWAMSLDDARKGVLINMTFNMGIQRLLGFKQMLAKVQAGDYEGAAVEMMNSRWAEQVGARAQRLSAQMRTGEWQ